MKLPNEQFWEVFLKTEGAFSCSEAIALYNICLEVPDGNYVELGTYKGKSALAATQGLKNGKFYLVEPEFIDEAWHSQVINMIFRNSVEHISPNGIADYSTNVVGNTYAISEPYSYVMIDSGSHQDGLPMKEVKLLEDRMISGGIIAFHDFRSQFIEVEQAYIYLLSTGKYEEIIIDWNPINQYVIENNLESKNNSWHHKELETPNFLGALKRK